MQIQPKHVLKGHAEAVSTIVFSPDSLSLASGSEDKTVMFGLDEGGLGGQTACTMFGMFFPLL